MKKIIPIMLLVLSGCASVGVPNSKDPMEGFNRTMFNVHEVVDGNVIKPVAQGYDYIMPDPIKIGVSNFFGNIGDIPNAINNLLQFNLKEFGTDLLRLGINTTVGILGVFDVASEAGLDKSNQDFGLTLAKWGVGDGPYLFIPLLGPSTIRDGAAKVVDYGAFNPISYVNDVPVRNQITAGKIVDKRYNLLSTDKALEEASIDKYNYVRNAYFQYRYYQISQIFF